MNRLGSMLLLALFASCTPSSHRAPVALAPAHTQPAAMPAGTPAVYEVPAPAEDPMPASAPVAIPAAAVTPLASPTVAVAEVAAIGRSGPTGRVTFTREDDGTISIAGELHGLKKKGVNAFYVHEHGDCSDGGKHVGGHLNPTHAKHGPPASSQRHAGDFGNLTADASGDATFAMTTDSVTMEAGRPDSVLDRAVVIHARKDDKRGSAGAPIACGVIELVTE